MQPKILFGVALAIALSVIPVRAESPQNTTAIAGVWRGTVRSAQNRPAPIVLDVKPALLGESAGTIAWGKPYTCASGLELADVGGLDGTQTYYLSLASGNGGYCDTIRDGQVELTTLSAGTLRFVVLPPKGTSALHDTTVKKDPPRKN